MKEKRKRNKENALKSGLDLWKSLPEEEKDAYVSSCRPFVIKWLHTSKDKRVAIEYLVAVVLFLLAVLLAKADPIPLKLLSLLIFCADWAFFSFVETCSRKKSDAIEGILAIDYYRSCRSKASSTTDR